MLIQFSNFQFLSIQGSVTNLLLLPLLLPKWHRFAFFFLNSELKENSEKKEKKRKENIKGNDVVVVPLPWIKTKKNDEKNQIPSFFESERERVSRFDLASTSLVSLAISTFSLNSIPLLSSLTEELYCSQRVRIAHVCNNTIHLFEWPVKILNGLGSWSCSVCPC